MALAGSYRRIVIRPEEVKWEGVSFAKEDGSEEQGVKIEFILPSSAYATVCLRDIIGEEVGVDND